MSTHDRVLVSVIDHVATVTLNRPDKRNGLDLEMFEAIVRAGDALAADTRVRAVVLEGAGKVFCAGLDWGAFLAMGEQASPQLLARDGRSPANLAQRVGWIWQELPVPVIAALHGAALGGGLQLALGADVRIAASDAQFGIPAAKLGLAYGFDMVRTLTSLVGPAHAKTLLFTGERIDAAEAERIGLVNRTVPVEQLPAAVAQVATTMAGNAPLTLRAAKTVVAAALRDESARDMEAVEAVIAACFDSADYREGRRAFLEKRKPVFTGT